MVTPLIGTHEGKRFQLKKRYMCADSFEKKSQTVRLKLEKTSYFIKYQYACALGVSCDGCSVTAFVGNRYKCLRCSDYDLCFGCYTMKNFGDQAGIGEAPIHDDSHPMQMILSSVDFGMQMMMKFLTVPCLEQVYEGETRRYEERKIVSFTCPYCNITGLTDRQFGNHVNSVHSIPPNFTVVSEKLRSLSC